MSSTLPMNSSEVMPSLLAKHAMPSLEASVSYMLNTPRACMMSVGVMPILWMRPSFSIVILQESDVQVGEGVPSPDVLDLNEILGVQDQVLLIMDLGDRHHREIHQ